MSGENNLSHTYHTRDIWRLSVCCVVVSGSVQSYYSAAANFALLYPVPKANFLRLFRFSFLLAALHHTILQYSIIILWCNI